MTSYTTDIPPLEDCSELFTTPTPTSATLIHCSSAALAPDSAAKDDEGFAGMKKGFLNRGKVSVRTEEITRVDGFGGRDEEASVT